MTSQLIIAASYGLSSAAFDQRLCAHSAALLISTVFISAAFNRCPRYHSRCLARKIAMSRDVALSWSATVAVLLVLGMASGTAAAYDGRVMLTWFLVTPVALVASRFAMQAAADAETRSAVVIGYNEVCSKFAAACASHPAMSIDMQGFFDDRATPQGAASMSHPLLGSMANVAHYTRQHNIKLIFISLPMSAQPRIRQLIDELHDTTASVYFLPDVYTFNLMQGRVNAMGGMPAIAICETPLTGINRSIKRASDIVFAVLMLITFAPLMAAIALAIKLSSRGPAIFRQRRYGLHGEEIIVYKFRSMLVSEDEGPVIQASKDDPRVTRLGAFLRRSSLDELPQLINVLQGRMSLVGPRPHAVAHNELYRKLIKGYMLRHKVKPGITGWAQVHGLRGETATLDRMQARIDHDLAYLRDWSIWRDMWIMLLTVKTVLGRDNAH